MPTSQLLIISTFENIINIYLSFIKIIISILICTYCFCGFTSAKLYFCTQKYVKFQVLSTAPPSRKIQNDFSSDTIRQEWVESNLREQLAILQCLLLIANELRFSVEEFTLLFGLFRKHSFGKRQGYNEFLEERHREQCLNVMFVEVCIFMVVMDCDKM